MMTDEQLIRIAHRRHRQFSQWGRATGWFVACLGLITLISGYSLLIHLLHEAVLASDKLARLHDADPGFNTQSVHASFFIGVVVGSALLFVSALGLFAVVVGVAILVRGDWRDGLIVRLTSDPRQNAVVHGGT